MTFYSKYKGIIHLIIGIVTLCLAVIFLYLYFKDRKERTSLTNLNPSTNWNYLGPAIGFACACLISVVISIT